MRKKRKSHKYVIVLLALTLILLSFSAYSLYDSKYGLVTTYYSLDAPALSDSVRILQLTDQHGTVFGKDNERLIEAVQEASPDLILITGDVINYKSEDPDQEIKHATDLIQKLTGIAPVYISYGNHEDVFDASYQKQRQDQIEEGTTSSEMEGDDALEGDIVVVNDAASAPRHALGSIGQLFEQAGATLLDYEYQDIEIKGQKLRIGGIYGYCQIEQYAMETHREAESEFLKAFQDCEHYKILMCHMPVCWLGLSLYDWDVDCVFAGHAHGGQIQIPFVGGLWAPDQGWFPGKEYGVYDTDEERWDSYKKRLIDQAKKAADQGTEEGFLDSMDKSDLEAEPFKSRHLVLSRGLGSTEKVPRFNNIPEIVVVDFIPD